MASADGSSRWHERASPTKCCVEYVRLRERPAVCVVERHLVLVEQRGFVVRLVRRLMPLLVVHIDRDMLRGVHAADVVLVVPETVGVAGATTAQRAVGVGAHLDVRSALHNVPALTVEERTVLRTRCHRQSSGALYAGFDGGNRNDTEVAVVAGVTDIAARMIDLFLSESQ
eukprot:61377-Pyramimonas_sp.AAC.1